MTLPQNYARVLLTRAALLIGFGSLLLFTAQVLGRPAATTTPSYNGQTTQQAPKAVTFEQTTPSTSGAQNEPTAPAEGPQTPSVSAPQSPQAPNESTAQGNTVADNTSFSVSCINNLCNTSVTSQSSLPAPIGQAPSYRPCKVCSVTPVNTERSESAPCPVMYCPD